MADGGDRGRISPLALGMVAAGAVLVWAAINDPPAGIPGAVRDILTTGKPIGKPTATTTAATTATLTSAHAASGSGAQVVAVALTYEGDPYVWAGESHSGIDCSGLVLVAYRDGAGIQLPHLATLQAARGRPISASEVQAGDLVAWGVPGNYPHIAIALDQTNCIASWTYGVGVKRGPIHQRAVVGFGYPDFYRIL